MVCFGQQTSDGQPAVCGPPQPAGCHVYQCQKTVSTTVSDKYLGIHDTLFFSRKNVHETTPRISHEKHTHPSTHNQTTLDAASDMTPDINVPFPQRGSRDRTLGHPSTLTRRYTYAHTCKNKCRRRLFTYNSCLALMLSVL